MRQLGKEQKSKQVQRRWDGSFNYIGVGSILRLRKENEQKITKNNRGIENLGLRSG